jgi:uncharacterized protein with PhoU and TrkA domain
VVETCQRAGIWRIGVRRGDQVELNVGSDFSVEHGDTVITIGKGRVADLGDSH